MESPAVRSRSQKSTDRRERLAESALKTLGELGYARTSLREIAANSEFSHGVIHYYFADKTELITYCVRYYKAQCVTRYDELTERASSAAELSALFADKLGETLVEDTAMHRLWYDLRTQSMFEPVLREDVLMIDRTLEVMIWRVLERYAELAGRALVVNSATAYALIDGLFERAVLQHLAGTIDPDTVAVDADVPAGEPRSNSSAREILRAQVRTVVPTLV